MLVNPKDNANGKEKNARTNVGFLTFEKCLNAPEAIRKQRSLALAHLKQLQTPKRVMLTKLFELLELILFATWLTLKGPHVK